MNSPKCVSKGGGAKKKQCPCMYVCVFMCVCSADYSSYPQTQIYAQPPAVGTVQPDGSAAAQTSQTQPAVVSYASYQAAAAYQFPPASYAAASTTYPATATGYGQPAYPAYGVTPTSDVSGYAASSYATSGYVSSQSAASAYSTTTTTTQVSVVYRVKPLIKDTIEKKPYKGRTLRPFSIKLVHFNQPLL